MENLLVETGLAEPPGTDSRYVSEDSKNLWKGIKTGAVTLDAESKVRTSLLRPGCLPPPSWLFWPAPGSAARTSQPKPTRQLGRPLWSRKRSTRASRKNYPPSLHKPLFQGRGHGTGACSPYPLVWSTGLARAGVGCQGRVGCQVLPNRRAARLRFGRRRGQGSPGVLELRHTRSQTLRCTRPQLCRPLRELENADGCVLPRPGAV